MTHEFNIIKVMNNNIFLSAANDDVGVAIFISISCILIIVLANAILKSIEKNKILTMIKKAEQDSSDFDKSISIGDDRCKLYFDTAKKRVMIIQITKDEIIKKFIDGFEYPGEHLTRFSDGSYLVYEPNTRRLLFGNEENYYIKEIEKLEGVNKIGLTTKDPIAPYLNHLKTTYRTSISIISENIHVLVDEYHGLIVVLDNEEPYAFNYINVEKLPEKVGLESTISVKKSGNYMFVMDSFFKMLVIIGKDRMHKTINYSDIIEVSYIENGDQLFTKSAGRTVGGAIIGGMLMGGAGAVVGGLSGDAKRNKVVNNMDIKILLRSIEDTTCILHFMDSSSPLETNISSNKTQYEEYLKNANEAKDLLSVIIDDAKQQLPPVNSAMSQPVVSQSLSVADELAKLAKLKAEGTLTEEEFQTQKTKLLNL